MELTLHIGRTECAISPLTLLFPLVAARLGMARDLVPLLMSLAVHESGHLLAAKALGVGIVRIRLMPFGGAITLENPYALSPARQLATALAGPASNLLLLLTGAALAHWRLIAPAFALSLVKHNLILMAFNLLPTLPLDGGRALFPILSARIGPERALNAGILMGRACAAALVLLAAAQALALKRLNLSPLFAAVCLVASGRYEREALSSAHLRALLRAVRPPGEPMEARLFAVSELCPVETALKAARPDALTLYAVYRGGRLRALIDDRRLLDAALERGDLPVGDIAAAT